MNKYTIKESELKRLVEESVRQYINENDIEEGWGDAWRATKNTVLNPLKNKIGTSVSNAKQKVQGAMSDAGEWAQEKYNNAVNTVNKAKEDWSRNYELQKDASNKQKIAKENQAKIQNVINTLKDLQGQGIFKSQRTNDAINTVIKQFNMTMIGGKGNASQSYMKANPKI